MFLDSTNLEKPEFKQLNTNFTNGKITAQEFTDKTLQLLNTGSLDKKIKMEIPNTPFEDFEVGKKYIKLFYDEGMLKPPVLDIFTVTHIRQDVIFYVRDMFPDTEFYNSYETALGMMQSEPEYFYIDSNNYNPEVYEFVSKYFNNKFTKVIFFLKNEKI